MILHGNARGSAAQLATHLLRTDENEHVEVLEVSGFVSTDLREALHEAYAISRGTRCKQFLYSLSLNPPQNENVPVSVFEAAIRQVEEALNLKGQPRAIVFHEKEGRRHAHCVWSRIDLNTMKAINLPFTKRKLRAISQTLFVEQGWKMPQGLIDYEARNPMNFTHDEWQQTKRLGHDPRETKEMFRQLFAAADSRRAFEAALEERGFTLAQGDRRGFVAVDYRGEVYSVARYAGIRTKEVREKFGEPGELQSVSEAKDRIARQMLPVLKAHFREVGEVYAQRMAVLEQSRSVMVQRHRQERTRMAEAQKERWQRENLMRAARFRRGMKGLWDRVTGQHARMRKENERHTDAARQRDLDERQILREAQLGARRQLQSRIVALREEKQSLLLDIRQDAVLYRQMVAPRSKEQGRSTKPVREAGMSFDF